MDSQSPSTVLVGPGTPLQIPTGPQHECKQMTPAKCKKTLSVQETMWHQ